VVWRTRRQLKSKYGKEYRENPEHIDLALHRENRLKFGLHDARDCAVAFMKEKQAREEEEKRRKAAPKQKGGITARKDRAEKEKAEKALDKEIENARGKKKPKAKPWQDAERKVEKAKAGQKVSKVAKVAKVASTVAVKKKKRTLAPPLSTSQGGRSRKLSALGRLALGLSSESDSSAAEEEVVAEATEHRGAVKKRRVVEAGVATKSGRPVVQREVWL